MTLSQNESLTRWIHKEKGLRRGQCSVEGSTWEWSVHRPTRSRQAEGKWERCSRAVWQQCTDGSALWKWGKCKRLLNLALSSSPLFFTHNWTFSGRCYSANSKWVLLMQMNVPWGCYWHRQIHSTGLLSSGFKCKCKGIPLTHGANESNCSHLHNLLKKFGLVFSLDHC